MPADFRMKSDIDFDELMYAFEYSHMSHHFFIDAKENMLVEIDDEAEFQDEIEKQFEEMEDERYIPLPERMPADDLKLRELFLFDIAEQEEMDYLIIEKFHHALERSKPFRNFKILLEIYPEIKSKWFAFKEKEIKNDVINWLCEKEIEVLNMPLPKIDILEIDPQDHIPEEWKEFAPLRCINCKNTNGLKARFFSINIAPENKWIEQETKRIMRENYNIQHYGYLTGGKSEFLTVSQCPRCGSEDIFWGKR